uniref:Polyprotein allergen nematode domain-containing protein n=1 Tax=Parascaris equorum TaxID=6256 RepID=A0A914S2T6_PAREQ
LQVKEYFSELPAERQETIKGEFKKKCVSWIKEVANEEQIEQLKTLHEKLVAALCNEAWGVSVPSRSRREIDAVYKEWIGWMTDSQKSELESMRAAGSSFDEIHEKISGYFGQLEAGRRNELVKEYKVREYIQRLSPEKQEAVNRDLAICEQIWYDHHQHNWHHLRRRGLKVNDQLLFVFALTHKDNYKWLKRIICEREQFQ